MAYELRKNDGTLNPLFFKQYAGTRKLSQTDFDLAYRQIANQEDVFAHLDGEKWLYASQLLNQKIGWDGLSGGLDHIEETTGENGEITEFAVIDRGNYLGDGTYIDSSILFVKI
jgi:hypothetical protein